MSTKNNLLWLVAWFCCLGFAQAQVSNDDIENRRVLKTEEAVFSSTIGCTVQRTCVDESLTGKCVEYHNDQWFEFTPETSGDYFVNISNQACRDVRGVQLVFLTGKPCQPATYQIISCTSLATQDDIFVALKALLAGQTYLLNVDGYLNDQCRFRISLSRKPHGMPAAAELLISAAAELQSRKVALTWHLPDSLVATEFRVLRREAAAFKTQEIGRISINRDSYGKVLREYSFQDSLLQPGNYLYQIVAEGGAEPVLLQQEWKRFRNLANTPRWYQIPLEKYSNKSELFISITDAATGKILQRAVIRKQKNKPEQGKVLINNWQATGIQTIRVEIQERRKGKTISSSNFLVGLED